MQKLSRGIDFLTNVFAVISGVAVTILMIHISVDVVARSGFNIALPGTIVFVSNYYMVALVCLPLAFVERHDSHISVDVFTGLLPRRYQIRVIGWAYPLSTVVFALVAYSSWLEAVQQYRQGTFMIEQDIWFPVWFGYFALPVGYGLGAVYMALRFVQFLAGRTTLPADKTAATIAEIEAQVEKFSHD